MKTIDLPYRTIFAELVQRSLDASFESDFSTSGNFVRVPVKDRDYWYFEETQPTKTRKYVDPADDPRRDYHAIYDASGDSALLDTLIARLAAGGEVVLAGFYSEPLSFAFPPAFMREARLRVAAEWREPDLAAVKALIGSGRLALDGLITHRRQAAQAAEAYRTAFNDPACLKMILDWRARA